VASLIFLKAFSKMSTLLRLSIFSSCRFFIDWLFSSRWLGESGFVPVGVCRMHARVGVRHAVYEYER
jgi:hypothetical protein